jgi:hypothetical protein
LTYTVIEDSVFEGKPVHRIVGGNDTYVYDMANSNMIATLRLGKEVSALQTEFNLIKNGFYPENGDRQALCPKF